MSSSMLIAATKAPVYTTPDKNGNVEIVTDYVLIVKQSSQLHLVKKFADLANADGDGFFDYPAITENLSDDELEHFGAEFDDTEGIEARRLTLVTSVVDKALGLIFNNYLDLVNAENMALEAGIPFENTVPLELSNEVTWISDRYNAATAWSKSPAFLLSGGLSSGDTPTEAFPALVLLDYLGLFSVPFQRPGQETPATTLASEEETKILYELNDHLTEELAAAGWNAESDQDYEELNDLTHNVAQNLLRKDSLVRAFLDQH